MSSIEVPGGNEKIPASVEAFIAQFEKMWADAAYQKAMDDHAAVENDLFPEGEESESPLSAYDNQRLGSVLHKLEDAKERFFSVTKVSAEVLKGVKARIEAGGEITGDPDADAKLLAFVEDELSDRDLL